MPTYQQAEASGLSKPQVTLLAEGIAKRLDFGPGDDIHHLVKRLGGKVEVEDTLTEDPSRSGSLFVESPTSFRIVVPTHTSQLRDRFTIAHELGHFFLHEMWRRQNGSRIDGPMMALRRGSERIEWEANWFAAGFLMPSEAFRESFNRNGGSIPAIAREFEVSGSAAEVRARQLNLTH
ncbi:MAG: ImmA/IrrE family metallo-endopeptidase [Caulobacteraceae bacterium]